MKLLHFSDRLTQQLQQNVREVVEPLAANPLASGRLVSNISLTSGITNVVPIGLDQSLVGWFLTRIDTNATVWDSQNANMTPSQNLYLHCSTNCIISIYVF